jgi:putative ABC transport system permease protein
VTTAALSVVHAALFERLPYPDPTRLFAVVEGGPTGSATVAADYIAAWWSDRTVALDLAAYWPRGELTLATEPPIALRGAEVSAGFLDTLGTHPLLGRDFDSLETQRPAAPVVIISHGLWRRLYGGRGEILGHRMTIDRRMYSIIGVLRPDFALPSEQPLGVDVLLPLTVEEGRSGERLRAILRLPAMADREAVEGRLSAIARAKGLSASERRVIIRLKGLREYMTTRARPLLLTPAGITSSTSSRRA